MAFVVWLWGSVWGVFFAGLTWRFVVCCVVVLRALYIHALMLLLFYY